MTASRSAWPSGAGPRHATGAGQGATHQQQARLLPILSVVRRRVLAHGEHVDAVALVEVDAAQIVTTFRGIVRTVVGILHVEQEHGAFLVTEVVDQG